ncbi:MAG: T9SS type A sorting domain-containing protein [Bacteroidia bacterium]
MQNTTTDGTALFYYQVALSYSGNTISALGNIYKEVVQNGTLTTIPFSGNPTWNTINGPAGYAFRQDVALKKVYAYDVAFQTESILIDFNLQVGDTLTSSKIIWGTQPSPFIINSVDSVLILGTYHRRYNFPSQGMYLDTSIIEGIGCTSGLFGPPFFFELGGHLICFSHFGYQLYIDDTASTTPCGIVSVPEYANPESLNIYADYSYQFLHVEIPDPAKNYSYLLMDITGKDISRGKLPAFHNIVDINTLAHGVYFLKAYSSEQSFVRKFVKP